MTTVQDTIPEALSREVEAARNWFNRTEELDFEVTGIVNPEAALEASKPRELSLILCAGNRCEKHRFAVTARDDDYDVVLLEDERLTGTSGAPLAELDPPPGGRRSWLDQVLGRHAFVLLVFYRGYW